MFATGPIPFSDMLRWCVPVLNTPGPTHLVQQVAIHFAYNLTLASPVKCQKLQLVWVTRSWIEIPSRHCSENATNGSIGKFKKLACWQVGQSTRIQRETYTLTFSRSNIIRKLGYVALHRAVLSSLLAFSRVYDDVETSNSSPNNA